MGKTKKEPMRIGFWRNERHPELPVPKARKKPLSYQAEILAGLLYLESKAKRVMYRGYSRCRICGCTNGSAEYEHELAVWPAGLRHYIVEHNVQLDAEAENLLLHVTEEHKLAPVKPATPEMVIVDSDIWNQLLKLAKLDMHGELDPVVNLHERFANLIKMAERKRKRLRGG